jgi:hypothetical protein
MPYAERWVICWPGLLAPRRCVGGQGFRTAGGAPVIDSLQN